MFDFSLGEILLVVIVALVFIGPKEMPVVAKGIASFLRALRSLAREIRAAFDEMAEESGLKEAQDDINRQVRLIRGDDGQLYESYDVSDIAQKRKTEN